MTNEELFVATALAAWKTNLARMGSGLMAMSDADLHREIAPGKNRISYLVGHLTVVHDRMFPQMGLGERLHPELDAEFFANPDRATQPETSLDNLRKAWHDVHNKLTPMFEAVTPAQWLEKHTLVTVEDFAKEPMRNRFALLLSRTNHMWFHAGQIRLVK